MRKWESRYGVVTPSRTASGRRVYGQQEIDKLLLVKELVDRGHSISSLAQQPLEALQRLLDRAQESPRLRTVRVPETLVLVGPILATNIRLARARFPQTLNLEFVPQSAEQWLTDPPEAKVDETLVVECPTLNQKSTEKLIERAATQPVVAVYGYLTRNQLTALEQADILCLRAPVSAATLRDALFIAAPQPAPPPSPPGEPRFDDATLARVAALTPAIKCECPQHVAELLQRLAAFERYSATCEEQEPGDRQLHEYLKQVAGSSRSLFEDALERVALAEGLEL